MSPRRALSPAAFLPIAMRRLLVLLLLAGCQPVPHPFADLGATAQPALRPPDSAGVIVDPVQGAPAEAAESLAAALRDSDVPASTVGGNRESFHLDARADTAPAAAGHGAVTLAWVLRGPTGKTVGRGTAQEEQDAEVWGSLAREAAPRITALISGDAPPEADDVPAAVKVGDVAGAPGDGGTSLARAIGSALGHAGIEVGEGDAKFALSCKVDVEPPKDGKQLVTVRWILALPAGRQLGEVSQQNTVPAGSLDGAWGDVAYAVAGAAVPGIAQLIERAQE